MISVFLPTRGRPVPLAKSIASLLDNADNPDGVEVLLAVDPDDDATIDVTDRLPECRVFVAPERFGYLRLHEYVNYLATQARGECFLLWNDDAEMLTEGWDTIVEEAPADQCLFMDAWYPCFGERGNVFPVWPAAWSYKLGYVSPTPNIDVWISEIAARLGRQMRLPQVRAAHFREYDDTHAEGRDVMGDGNDPGYDSARLRAERARAVRIIREMYAS